MRKIVRLIWNLYITSSSMGFFAELLDTIIIVSFLSGIFTIIAKNPIVSVLYLIFLFANISIYLITIGIVFIGISYLLVYVGAVSILFLFILMLINIRVSELINETNNNIPLAILTIIILFVPLSTLLPDNPMIIYKNYFDVNKDFISVSQNKNLLYVSSNSWDNTITDISDIMSIGNIMYTNYSIWLIITSIILLLAMVGSIIITIKQKY